VLELIFRPTPSWDCLIFDAARRGFREEDSASGSCDERPDQAPDLTQQKIVALNASRLAIAGDGSHVISRDKVINTMRDTGRDTMSEV
jgi:hypothetical protein